MKAITLELFIICPNGVYTNNNAMKVTILGVTIDSISKTDLLKKVADWLCNGHFHYIVTVNPEFIMAARRDESFRHILNAADLAVADGVGIELAARRMRERLAERITGVDLVYELCQLAAEKGSGVYLLGARRGIAERAAFRLQQRFPTLRIVGAECGYRHWHRPLPDTKLIDHINRKKPDILLVAFGQVKQEKWIVQQRRMLPSVRVAMGVGGAFDYISGAVPRAPMWIRRLGLEWSFRLLRQPWRLPRIVTAVVKFGWTMIRLPHA